MLAQIHVPKHESTPFLKHACYEQCLLLKDRAQWEAAYPGGLCCVEDLVEGRFGTLSECRINRLCALTEVHNITLHFSPPPPFPIFAIPVVESGDRVQLGLDSFQQDEVLISARGRLEVS